MAVAIPVPIPFPIPIEMPKSYKMTYMYSTCIAIRIRTILKAGADGRLERAKKVLAITVDEITDSVSGNIPVMYKELVQDKLEQALYLMYLDVLDAALDMLIDAVNILDMPDITCGMITKRLQSDQNKDLGSLVCLPSDVRWHLGSIIASSTAEYSYC